MVNATQHKLMQLVGAHPYGSDGVDLGLGQARRPQMAALRTVQAPLDKGWPIAVPRGKQVGPEPARHEGRSQLGHHVLSPLSGSPLSARCLAERHPLNGKERTTEGETAHVAR